MIKVFFKYPLVVYKNLSRDNLYKLKNALKNENPTQIKNNIKKYFQSLKSIDKDALLTGILNFSKFVIDKEKELVLFVSHEASRTGAPLIILKVAEQMSEIYSIQPIFLLCEGGAIQSDFEKVGPTYTIRSLSNSHFFEYEVRTLFDLIIKKRKIKRAYVNSVESRKVLKYLKMSKVDNVITLIHELGYYYQPNSWDSVPKYSDKVIFPAEYVKKYAFLNSNFLEDNTFVKGQGLLKPELLNKSKKEYSRIIRDELGIDADARIILACGSQIARKGIDLFVTTAISFLNDENDRNTYFVWIGAEVKSDAQFWIKQDVRFSNFGDNIKFIGARADTEEWFAGSDLFFLCSRGDPFPCVAHEALASGLPIVLFDNSGGISEILNEDMGIIVPYGDVSQAAIKIKELLSNESRLVEMANNCKEYAKANLDFRSYTRFLESLK